jgi:tetratricopeptide (TPR) repeat protein
LRALTDWSYDLLSEPERVLLQRLSIFVRGWSLEAAETVGSGEGIEREAILELLAHLVDKSLVVRMDRSGEARYTMLESIREYAREKLVDSGGLPALRRRHFEYFFQSAVDTPLWADAGGTVPIDYGIDYENSRAAFDWIESEPNSINQALVLAGSLIGPASARGRVGELGQILKTTLARSDPAAKTFGRARALLASATIAAMQGNFQVIGPLAEEAVQLLRGLPQKRELALALMMAARGLPDAEAAGHAMRESRALLEELGDHWGVGMLLFNMADAALARGDYDAARSGHTESLALFRKYGNVLLSSLPLLSLGRIACLEGEYARARTLVEEALAIRERPDFDNPWQVAMAKISLGEVDRCEGDPARGAHLFEEALATGRGLGDDMIVAWALHNLGHVALNAGDITAAATLFEESLQLRQRSGPSDVAAGLAGMAGVGLRNGALDEAARLFAQVDSMLESTHSVLPPADELVRRADLARLRERNNLPSPARGGGQGGGS